MVTSCSLFNNTAAAALCSKRDWCLVEICNAALISQHPALPQLQARSLLPKAQQHLEPPMTYSPCSGSQRPPPDLPPPLPAGVCITQDVASLQDCQTASTHLTLSGPGWHPQHGLQRCLLPTFWLTPSLHCTVKVTDMSSVNSTQLMPAAGGRPTEAQTQAVTPWLSAVAAESQAHIRKPVSVYILIGPTACPWECKPRECMAPMHTFLPTLRHCSAH